MRADNTKYNRAQQFLITYYPRALFQLHSALSTRYVRRVELCARDRILRRTCVMDFLRASNLNRPNLQQYSDIGHGFFTFLETGSSLRKIEKQSFSFFFSSNQFFIIHFRIVISLYKIINGYRFLSSFEFFFDNKNLISVLLICVSSIIDS